PPPRTTSHTRPLDPASQSQPPPRRTLPAEPRTPSRRLRHTDATRPTGTSPPRPDPCPLRPAAPDAEESLHAEEATPSRPSVASWPSPSPPNIPHPTPPPADSGNPQSSARRPDWPPSAAPESRSPAATPTHAVLRSRCQRRGQTRPTSEDLAQSFAAPKQWRNHCAPP